VIAAASVVASAWAAPPKDEAAASGKPAVAKAVDEEEKLEPYQCGKVQRLHTLGGVFLASQPEKEDFTHAKEGGIKTVLNLREGDEVDWDEGELVKSLGMEYVNIPFKTPSTLTDEVFDKSRKLLGDKEKRPLLVHCSSANRVGAVWLAHRVLDGGKTYDEALKEAKTVGLKLPAYEEKAKDYIERMQTKAAAEKN
jgi:uncharacterized protein (TIGR01244 family)